MDVLDRTPPPADHRIHYGVDSSQFGDLWISAGNHVRPVLVFLHGGWWQSGYDLLYGGHLCAALRSAGLAVWSIEYRRVGRTGGGWPDTFRDAAAGFEYLHTLAKTFPVDLQSVVACGHSAGGHLAFWLAGRHHIPAGSPVEQPRPRIPMRAVVGLAAAVDLRLLMDAASKPEFVHDRREVVSLMGGTPEEVPERYMAGDPGLLLPLGCPQVLVQGTADEQIPVELPGRWAEKAGRQGEHVSVRMIPGAGHFDVVDPESKAWPAVREAISGCFSRREAGKR